MFCMEEMLYCFLPWENAPPVERELRDFQRAKAKSFPVKGTNLLRSGLSSSRRKNARTRQTKPCSRLLVDLGGLEYTNLS